VWPGGAVFAVGAVKVLVRERAVSRTVAERRSRPAFGVEELDSACEGLRARGLELLVQPREYPWGRSAYLRDPDRRLLELSQTT
jgi:catechol 2,3-dioxygenase-like lactoylglutathione lyase family enzyme